MRRPRIPIALAPLLLIVTACKTTPPAGMPAAPLPAYESIAQAQNQRVERLGRLWARTIVSLRYDDEKGNARYEQGDGHLQRLDFHDVALDVGKLGQVLFWFGANQDLYWLFDLSDPDHTVAYVGQHALVTLDKAARASFPIPPVEYVALAGLTAIPEQAPAATIARDDDDRVVLDVADRGFSWRYHFDPVTLLPMKISMLDAESRPVITADLSEYRTVDLTGVGVDQPSAPARIAISHLPTQTSITLTIDGDIIDGRRSGKPKPAAFDFDVLRNALNPDEVIDLDKPEQLAPDDEIP